MAGRPRRVIKNPTRTTSQSRNQNTNLNLNRNENLTDNELINSRIDGLSELIMNLINARNNQSVTPTISSALPQENSTPIISSALPQENSTPTIAQNLQHQLNPTNDNSTLFITKYKIDHDQLNYKNYLSWSIIIKLKLKEWNSEYLLNRNPTNDEQQISNKIFGAIFSSISEEIKSSLQIVELTPFNLMREIEKKFDSLKQINISNAINYVKNIKFQKNQNIIKYTSFFNQQIDILNKSLEQLPKIYQMLFFINSFNEVPEYQNALQNYLQQNPDIELNNLVNFINLYINNINSNSRMSINNINKPKENWRSRYNQRRYSDNNKSNNNFKNNYSQRNYRIQKKSNYRWNKNNKKSTGLNQDNSTVRDSSNQNENNVNSNSNFDNNSRNNFNKNSNNQLPSIIRSANQSRLELNSFSINNYNKSSSNWVIDSGAEVHAINDDSNLINFKQINTEIKTFDNKSCYATGIGDLKLKLKNKIIIELKDVYYIPSANNNYLSVSKLNLSILFTNKFVYALIGKKYVNIGLLQNNKYVLSVDNRHHFNEINSITVDPFTNTSSNDPDYHNLGNSTNLNKNFNMNVFNNLVHTAKNTLIDKNFEIPKSMNNTLYYHLLFGHLNRTKLRHLMKLMNLSYEHFNCEACNFFNLKRSIPKFNLTFINRPLQKVHIDVFYFENTCWDDTKYCLIIIDDFTEFTFVYPIIHKSDCKEIILNKWLPRANNLTGFNVLNLFSDNGGEFIDKQLVSELELKGIQLIYTVPYCPFSNGLVERKIQTIKKKSNISISTLPKEFKNLYNESVVYNNQIINSLPYGTNTIHCPNDLFNINFTPRKLFYFGQYVNYLIGPAQKQFRGQGVFVSYGDSHKGFRIFDKKLNRVIAAAHIDSMNLIEIIKNVNQNENLNNEINQNPNLQDERINNLNDYKSTELDLIYELDNKSYHNNDDTTINLDISMCEFCINNLDELQSDEPEKQNLTEQVILKYLNCFNKNKEIKIPKTYKEAMSSAEADSWHEAIMKEYSSLLEFNTWSLVERPKDANIIKTRWVFAIKIVNEQIIFKARLVAKGFQQTENEYLLTYSPTLDLEALRLMISLAQNLDYKISYIDFSNAFLHAEIDKIIYLEQPEGFKTGDYVCKLSKSLYGLKQSNRLWFEKLKMILISNNFRQLKSNLNIFVNDSKNIIIAAYVDDILVITKDDKVIDELVNNLKNQNLIFKFENQLKKILNISIKYDSDKNLYMNQTDKIIKIATKFNIESTNNQQTPVRTTNLFNDFNESKLLNLDEINEYQSGVGLILFIARCTRPDVQIQINQLSKYTTKPTVKHQMYLKQLIQYLFNTKNLNLIFKYNQKDKIDLIAFSDSDYGNDVLDRKSISGSAVFLNKNLISWQSKKQKLVALSSNESEIIGANECSRIVLYFKNMIDEILKINCTPEILVDNTHVIHYAQNGIGQRTKHLDIKIKFLYDIYNKKLIKLSHVPTKDNVADIFTKFVDKSVFIRLFKNLNLSRCN